MVTATPRPATSQYHHAEGMSPFPLVPFQKVPRDLCWLAHSVPRARVAMIGISGRFGARKKLFLNYSWKGGCWKDRKIGDHYKHLISATSCSLGFED